MLARDGDTTVGDETTTTTTTFMTFRPKSRNDRVFSIRVDGVVVEESKAESLLGFQVERSLDWEDHIKEVT